MFQQLLQRIALALSEQGIPYMVIGGQAVLLYGEPRLTKDVDVTLGVGPDRLNDVLCAVEDQAWNVLVENPRSFVEETMVLPCEDPQTEIRIDFVFSTSRYEQQAIKRARAVALGSVEVSFASVEDLVIHKMIAGRARDLEDVKNLLIRNPDMDLGYIRDWLRQFDEALSESLTSRFEQLLDETR